MWFIKLREIRRKHVNYKFLKRFDANAQAAEKMSYAKIMNQLLGRYVSYEVAFEDLKDVRKEAK